MVEVYIIGVPYGDSTASGGRRRGCHMGCIQHHHAHLDHTYFGLDTTKLIVPKQGEGILSGVERVGVHARGLQLLANVFVRRLRALGCVGEILEIAVDCAELLDHGRPGNFLFDGGHVRVYSVLTHGACVGFEFLCHGYAESPQLVLVLDVRVLRRIDGLATLNAIRAIHVGKHLRGPVSVPPIQFGCDIGTVAPFVRGQSVENAVAVGYRHVREHSVGIIKNSRSRSRYDHHESRLISG